MNKVHESIMSADHWLQKHFNNIIHAFMRSTGATKRGIRRNAGGLLLLCAMLSSIYLSKYVWTVLQLSMFSWLIYKNDKADAQAEHCKFCWSDADRDEGIFKFLGALCVGLGLYAIFTGSLGALYYTISFTSDLAFLFLGYLCGMPKEPPFKEQEDVLLEPKTI